jgi:hypothetical protein
MAEASAAAHSAAILSESPGDDLSWRFAADRPGPVRPASFIASRAQ